jgi:hypothetical protein
MADERAVELPPHLMSGAVERVVSPCGGGEGGGTGCGAMVSRFGFRLRSERGTDVLERPHVEEVGVW